jgi:hypothetical protein
MEGLFLKDWYMIKNYCRTNLIIVAVFVAVSLAGDNMFFMIYPCLLCGMIPVQLLGCDEKSRWVQYSGTMPYTKTQIVSEKYWIGSIAQLIGLIVTGVVRAAKMMLAGEFIPEEFAVLMLCVLIVSTLAPSISLPFIFKLGVEKGKTAYYAMIGFICAAGGLASNLHRGQPVSAIKLSLVLAILAVVGIGVYLLSWYLSIVFCEKREI